MTFFRAKLDSEKNGSSAVQLRLHSQIYNHWRPGKKLEKCGFLKLLDFSSGKLTGFMTESGLFFRGYNIEKLQISVFFEKYRRSNIQPVCYR